MALTRCPACGAEVSDQANNCIKCGNPIRKPNPGETSSLVVYGYNQWFLTKPFIEIYLDGKYAGSVTYRSRSKDYPITQPTTVELKWGAASTSVVVTPGRRNEIHLTIDRISSRLLANLVIPQPSRAKPTVNSNFIMAIEEIFQTADGNAVVTGTIKRGVIHRNDAVSINDAIYTVTAIDKLPHRIEFAGEGMRVGLHLPTTNLDAFKPGDVVTDFTGPKRSTFVCDVCKLELPIAYRHAGNTCAECVRTGRAGNRAAAPDPHTVPEKYLSDLREYAIRLLPTGTSDVTTQRAMFRMVGAVIPVMENLLSAEILQVFATNSLGSLSAPQLQGMIAANTNQLLSMFNKEKIAEKIRRDNTEILIRCWIVLTLYCDLLSPENKTELTGYAELIAAEIYNRKFPIPAQKEASPAPAREQTNVPVRFDGNHIFIRSDAFVAGITKNPVVTQFTSCAILPLSEKTPVITLYEDGEKRRTYRLQTENGEDFTGKYFHLSVRLGIHGQPAVPVALIDGFVSDTPEERRMTPNDIGYRMEVHFLTCGGEAGRQRYEMLRGQDLPMKALKYQGYTTPANVRLIGICPDCGNSFAFHSYAFYIGQNDVAYSDDGLDCCEIPGNAPGQSAQIYQVEGKVFRYYNSFNCPHCGAPYIDYKKYPQSKVFGVSGCVHLGRKPYRAN